MTTCYKVEPMCFYGGHKDKGPPIISSLCHNLYAMPNRKVKKVFDPKKISCCEQNATREIFAMANLNHPYIQKLSSCESKNGKIETLQLRSDQSTHTKIPYGKL